MLTVQLLFNLVNSFLSRSNSLNLSIQQHIWIFFHPQMVEIRHTSFRSCFDYTQSNKCSSFLSTFHLLHLSDISRILHSTNNITNYVMHIISVQLRLIIIVGSISNSAIIYTANIHRL